MVVPPAVSMLRTYVHSYARTSPRATRTCISLSSAESLFLSVCVSLPVCPIISILDINAHSRERIHESFSIEP